MWNGILLSSLTHWGQVMHMCVSKIIIIGSDKGFSSGRGQATVWTNAGILLIGPLGIHFNEILIEINTFSFKKLHSKMSSAQWRLFGLSLNELRLNVNLPCFSVEEWFKIQIRMYIFMFPKNNWACKQLKYKFLYNVLIGLWNGWWT